MHLYNLVLSANKCAGDATISPGMILVAPVCIFQAYLCLSWDWTPSLYTIFDLSKSPEIEYIC